MEKKICFFSTFLFFSILMAQSQKSHIKLSGQMGLSYDYYDYNAYNFSSFRPRYEPNILRFNANARLQVGKYLSIPFGLSISNRKTSYNLPDIPNENLVDYIQNPRNNIHIDPTYKWFKAHLGSHTPDYSTLSTGDIQIFGIGFEINPGKLILSTNYGISQVAVEPDIILNIPGAYKQKLMGAQIGYGKLKGNKLVFNIVKIKDEVNSVNMAPLGYDPIEGITVSPLLQFKVFNNLILKTETAASVYTSNLNALPLTFNNNDLSQFDAIITINSSSVLDYAHNTSLTWKSKKFLLGAEVKYIGPGFMPVGYRNIEKDIIDYKINTGFKLFNKKLNFKGSFGIRNNNVNNTTLVSTKRIIASVNVFTQITKQLSLNTSFTNFGFNNNQVIPAQRIEMINNAYTLSPTYQFKTKDKQHIIAMNLSLNNFDQYNTTSLSFVTTKTQSFNTNYRLLFKKIPLNLGVNALLLTNKSPIIDMSISNLSVDGGYKLHKKKIKPSIMFGFMRIKQAGFTPDNRFVSKFKMTYKINKKLNIKMTYALNNNNYGTTRPGASVLENKAQFSINKKF